LKVPLQENFENVFVKKALKTSLQYNFWKRLHEKSFENVFKRNFLKTSVQKKALKMSLQETFLKMSSRKKALKMSSWKGIMQSIMKASWRHHNGVFENASNKIF
jgi:hypothetical protein